VKPRKATPETAKSIRCAIYTRKSTDEGLDQAFNSLDAQREAAEAYIASQKHEGWTCIPDRYDDGGYSGGTIDRPALRRLLADVEAGKVDAVVVYKVDRLSRSLLDFSRIIGSLDEQGVTFVSVTQQFNTTTSMGRLTLNILLSFAQFERELVSERTSDKMSVARRKGKWIGGSPLLGYDLDPNGGRLLVNEAEAAQVRGIFDLNLETESLLDTARELNRRGWTAKRWVTRAGPERGGKPFTKGTLFALLTNATYVGQVEFHRTIYPGEHAGIVDEAVWQRVQRRLRRNGRAGGQAVRNKHGALLSGLLRCVPCDSGMTHTYSQKGDRRYRYYVCSHAQRHGWETCPTKSIPAGEIERFVVDRIRAIGTDPGLTAEVLAKVTTETQVHADALARERKALERELARWAAEVRELVGSLPRPNGRQSAATARLVEVQDLTADAEARLAEIARQEATVAAGGGTSDDLVEVLRRFDPIWETLSPREQARIVHLLVEQVAYDGAKGTVAVTFRPGGIRALTEEGTA
jgi:site-specific DNA recombinase